jgi:hypothetical protein
LNPQFSQASESFKQANPHIFAEKSCPLAETAKELDTKEDLKSEKQLQDQLAGFLERNNIVVVRSRMDKKTGTAVGIPDLLFALRGRAVAFECKLPGKKQTKDQLEMMSKMMVNGWRCYVIEGYDKGVETINKLFLEFTLDAAKCMH